MKSFVHKIKDKVHETRANMKDDKGDQPSEFPRTVRCSAKPSLEGCLISHLVTREAGFELAGLWFDHCVASEQLGKPADAMCRDHVQ